MTLSSIRAVILEELVLHLLRLVGYRIVRAGEEGTRQGHAGLEVRGRGEWHQLDALAAFDRTPAFMYPLRLVVEAKCYKKGNKVGIEVVRNSVGVHKDISENYFSFRPGSGPDEEVQVPRFNYFSAIFSTGGYAAPAQRYAVAHQVFLIQYERVRVFEPVVKALLGLRERHIAAKAQKTRVSGVTSNIRETLRALLSGEAESRQLDATPFTQTGLNYISDSIVQPLLRIKGSYFGMLQGKWPMHLLSNNELPVDPFLGSDEVQCRVYGRDSDRWSFVPRDGAEGTPGWFRLEFDIPEEILELVNAARGNPVQVAEIKQQNFSFLDLAGKIGGVQRQVRLRLDEEWLEAYLDRVRNRNS